MDLHKLCEMAVALVERVEKTYEEPPTIRQVFMVVEVDQGDSLAYFKASSDDRTWVQEAFLDQAIDALFRSGEFIPDDE